MLHSIDVDDGAGKTVTRTYRFYRPLGLTNSLNNPVPLVVTITNSGWFKVAVSNGFAVLVIPNDVHCNGTSSACQYASLATNPDPQTLGARDCGPAGNASCDDAPWIKAILDAVECSGASPCENIDPTQVFASGSSKGGTMVEDLMCDPQTSGRFSGYSAVSAPMISPSLNNDPSVLPRCAAVLGAHPNVNFSAQWIFGDQDTIWRNACPSHVACLESGFTDARNRWTFGAAQLAGDKSFGQRVFGAALGCSDTPDTTQVSAHLIRKVYGSCAVAGSATSSFKVIGGGHGEPGVDGIDGFDADAESWSFWQRNLPAPSTAGGSSSDTVAPAVSISKPRARQALRSGRSHRRRTLRFAGTASDDSGVATVSLTVQQLRDGTTKCRWLDPARDFVRRRCSRPVRLTANLGRHGTWMYRVSRRIRLATGSYRVRAFGTDRAGITGNSAPARRRRVRFSVR